MESCPAGQTITVQGLLQRPSSFSVHHHRPAFTRGARDPDSKASYQTDPSSASFKESSLSHAATNPERFFSAEPHHLSETLGAHTGTGYASSTVKNQHIQADLLHLSEQTYVLLGWIQLWNSSPYEANCLAFSDSSGTICCAVTDFDPQLLGHPVRLLSWSYIPQREKGGCLEIRHLAPLETSGTLACKSIYVCPEAANLPNLVLETPPSKQRSKALRHTVTGCINFVSPPYSIPHGECRSKHMSDKRSLTVSKEPSNNSPFRFKKARTSMQGMEETNSSSCMLQHKSKSIILKKPLLGFFVGLSLCNHKPSCLPPRMDHDVIVERAAQCERESHKQNLLYIYFSGAIVAWRPLLLAMSGKCIVITRLRRKILVAREVGIKYGIYAATRISGVLLCSTFNMGKFKMRGSEGIEQMKSLNFRKGFNQQDLQCLWQQNHVGSYVGIVTEIFARGGLLELDGCVWLLLTNQPPCQICGLRVGARIAAFHVHFLRVTSVLERGLLLAACSISHLVVTQFSPLQTVCAGKQKSDSCLVHFIESLPFLSSFWALQVIACFRQKFRGFHSEKELLGSSKNMGIAEMYLRDSLSADNNKCRNIFGEFFSHSTSCSLAKHVTFNLAMQVPPIKNFYKHIQTMWLDPSSGLWNRQHKSFNNVVEILDTGQKANVFIRRVLSSDTLGVTILGFLEFSSMPGRLQLFDATGAVDVIIPDLQTAQIAPGAFQVTAYKLVVEGYLEAPMDVDNNLRCSPLSWYSLLKGTSRSLEASNNFSFFLIFSIKEARMVSYIKPPDFFTRIGEGQLLSPNLRPLKEYTCNFDILCVIHKHPLKSKSFVKQTGDCSFTFYVEAVRLPYRISMLHEQRKLFEDKEAVQNSWACTISVLSLSDFLDMSGKETSGKGEHQGYMSYPALLKRISSATRPKVERLLFQFSDLHQTAFQNIRIGQFYLVPSLQDPAIQTLHSGSLFWSFIADKDCGRSVEAEKMQVGLPDNGSNLPLVDVILKLPLTCQSEFSSSLNDARAVLSPVLSIKEVIDHGKFAIYKEHANDTGVLKGSLLSLCGIVGTREDLEICGLRTFTMKDLSSQLITVSCNSDQYLPLGFGPGAVVAIHRALLQILTEGEVSIKCIPSTLIEVCCVEADSFMGKSDCFKEIHFDKDQCKAQKHEHTTIKSLRLSSCINSSVPKLFKICCKVVSVDTLLLERIEDVNTCVRSWGVATYKVRLVSLQLDDGSGLAACGAKGDVAARLLSIPGQNSTRKRSMFDNMCFKQLNAIVKKYKRVLYQTVDPQQDPSSNGFMVEGAEGQGLDFADKKFIHAIVQRACHAGPLDVVAEHQIHENTGGELWQGQRRDIQSAKKTLGLSLLAKNVDVVKYETHMAAICVDLETTLGKEAFLQSGGNY